MQINEVVLVAQEIHYCVCVYIYIIIIIIIII